MSIPINTLYNQNVTCNGGNDGQTYVSAAGGTAPYTYLWDNGQTTDTSYNLNAGDYVVTVTDIMVVLHPIPLPLQNLQ